MSINFRKNNGISAHVNITNPESMGFPYVESIKSFANFCDEVIVVDGGSTDGSLDKIKDIPNVRIIQGEKWDRDFNWLVMAKNLNIGFLACKNKWAFHFDADYIFHEKNVAKLKESLTNSHLPAIEIPKMNFILTDEYFEKDNYPLIVNKGEYAVIRYGIGKDEKGNSSLSFLRPIAKKYTNEDGVDIGDPIRMSTCRLNRCDVPVYTYDFTFMTKDQVIENRNRFDNALNKCSQKENYKEIPKEVSFNNFMSMMKFRHKQCQQKGGKVGVKLEEHSEFIREKVANIQPEQFGCCMWGEL